MAPTADDKRGSSGVLATRRPYGKQPAVNAAGIRSDRSGKPAAGETGWRRDRSSRRGGADKPRTPQVGVRRAAVGSLCPLLRM